MTEEHKKQHDGQTVAAFPADPVRIGFAAAIKALIESLPAGTVRDIALAEIISAHERAEQAVRLRRVLN